MGIKIVSLSTVFRLDFGTVPAVWYFVFYTFFHAIVEKKYVGMLLFVSTI
jgi:hypothetical protein